MKITSLRNNALKLCLAGIASAAAPAGVSIHATPHTAPPLFIYSRLTGRCSSSNFSMQPLNAHVNECIDLTAYSDSNKHYDTLPVDYYFTGPGPPSPITGQLGRGSIRFPFPKGLS